MFAASDVALLSTIWIDAEKFEGASLGWCGPGVKGEEVFLVERGGSLDAQIGGEIGKECLEAVDRQAVVGASGGLIADGGFLRALSPRMLGIRSCGSTFASVITIMKLSNEYDFEIKLDRFHPRYDRTLPLALRDEEGEPK